MQAAQDEQLLKVLREAIRFARDSPLEGDGFELPVPGRIYAAAMRSPRGPRLPRPTCWIQFAVDSLLEGDGFEPSVPRKGPGILALSALVRGIFPMARNQ